MPECPNFPASHPRKLWLDAIKGVAIILVIMSHSENIPRLHRYLVACYMPLFFLASGYVYVEKAGALIRKWKKLLLPYIAWSLFYLFCACAVYSPDITQVWTWIGGIVYSRFTLSPVLTEQCIRLFPPDAHPMWFLTSMVISYAVFIPLLKTSSTRRPLLISLYFAISIGLSYCPVLLPWSLDTAFITSLFIYAGYRLKNVSLARLQCLLACLISGIIYIWLTRLNGTINLSIRQYGDSDAFSVIIFTLIGILGTIAYATFFMLIEGSIICRFFAYFGRISLSILCAHMFCIYIFRGICQVLIGNEKLLPKVISIPCRLAFVLLMCLLIHYLITRVRAWFISHKPTSTGYV